MTRDEFFALPTVMSQFPIVFPGGARWDEMVGECVQCEATLPDDRFRGDVSPVYGDPYRGSSATVSAFDMRAVGFCEKCVLLTPFDYRFHDDMTVSSMDGSDRSYVPTYSLWTRFKRLLRAGAGSYTGTVNLASDRDPESTVRHSQ